MKKKVSIIGLGTMGGRAAARAVAAGYKVVGFDPIAEAREAAIQNGVSAVDDLDIAVKVDYILLFLPKPETVRAVAEQSLVNCQPGTKVIDLSTIDPGSSRDVAAMLEKSNVTYIDAPVLGRPETCGQWTLVAGGNQADIAKASQVLLDVVAAHVVRVGSAGAGSVVKLLNNLMFGAINAVTAEALTLCVANGVDPELFVSTIADSGAATVSNLFKDIGPRMVQGDDAPKFSLDLLMKDNRLAAELAVDSRVSAPIAQVVAQLAAAAVQGGLGTRDTSALYDTYTSAAEAVK